MKFFLLLALCISLKVQAQTKQVAYTGTFPPAEQVAADFRKLLKRPSVDFRPSFRSFSTDSVSIERGTIYTEKTEQVPVLIYKPAKTGKTSFPVVICLHGTGGSKDDESILMLLSRLAQMGFMGVAIDARYHGERVPGGANKSTQYVDAITKAWENKDPSKQQHPFYFDTVYDLWRLTDYLTTRPDVQPDRIGMMGISMGGIETWMAASVDRRIKVAVPIIAAQSFQWSLQNNQWQGRAATIWKAHLQAAHDLEDTTVTKQNVERLWAKLLPGITAAFDCPSMIRLFAPRPLLLLSNEKDQNCPLPGAEIVFKTATEAYRSKNALDRLQTNVTPDEPHRFLPVHAEMALAWFKKWL